jgi:DNA (cytosine-5)-methyltransferase 1
MIDLFAGTGAFSRAFENYNIQCCFANDFCKNSQKIFKKNHKNHEKLFVYGDLNDIKNEDIPKHNILCAGFPCQPFSIAGKQAGFEDERSNVFWKIISIIDHHKPDVVILENVKNLQSHDKGNTFKVIRDKLCNDLKYKMVPPKVLNTSKITGIPQNRERIYIVCFKDEEKCNKFTLDFDETPNKEIKEFFEKETIPDKYYYTDRFKVYEAIKEGVTKLIDENVLYQYRRYYVRENKNNVCPTLTANMGGGGHNVPLLKDKKGIRRLTPRECFNLQGFPKDYELPEICDSALYKLAGNAVSLPVVKLIAERVANLF